jgi:hypothetical protein
MDTVGIIQATLDATGRGNYLEIGVCAGGSFIPLHAARKWGVDPHHCLRRRQIRKYKLFTLLNIRHEWIFKQTSDEFFLKHRRLLKGKGIDVGFVDGLHTYRQALTDVLNCLKYLGPNGVILMHDCNPTNEAMAFPANSPQEVADLKLPQWTGAWTGDVWKAIVHLRSLHDDLNVFVLDCDSGVGVVSRGRPAETLNYSEREIHEMDYSFLEKNRQKLLDLRPADSIYRFLQNRSTMCPDVECAK